MSALFGRHDAVSRVPARGPDRAPESEPPCFTRSERLALRIARGTNETAIGRDLQNVFLRGVAYPWMRASLARRILTDGLDALIALEPDRGVLLVSNHRSFFDQWAITVSLYMGPTPWARRFCFPVRANFFYERPLGIFVNYVMGGGVMYPPIFRQKDRVGLNRAAIGTMVDFLQKPGNVVGVHPEGMRNKSDDPYTLLPAQPGVGEVAMRAHPLIVPMFINGLINSLPAEMRANYSTDIRRERPCVIVYGKPIDYADFAAQAPRPALSKRLADRMCQEIAALMPRERDLRRQCAAGAIADDDPRWLVNRRASRFYARLGG